MKDRIWFHLSASRLRSSQPGQLVAAVPLTDAEALDLGLPTGQTGPGVRAVDASRDNDKINFKLTGKIADGHELVLSYADEKDDSLNDTSRGPLGINAALTNNVPEEALSVTTAVSLRLLSHLKPYTRKRRRPLKVPARTLIPIYV